MAQDFQKMAENFKRNAKEFKPGSVGYHSNMMNHHSSLASHHKNLGNKEEAKRHHAEAENHKYASKMAERNDPNYERYAAGRMKEKPPKKPSGWDAWNAKHGRVKKSDEEGNNMSDLNKADIGISDIFKGGKFAVDENGANGTPDTGMNKDASKKADRSRPGEGTRAESMNQKQISDDGEQPGKAGAGNIEGSHHGTKKGDQGEDNDVEKGMCKGCNKPMAKCSCSGGMKKGSDNPWRMMHPEESMHGLTDAQMAKMMESGMLGQVIPAPLDKRPRQ